MPLDVDDLRVGGVLLAALLVGWWVVARVRRWRRSRRPARLNPRLARYGGPDEVARIRREEAEKILATSSTGSIAGYEVREQIEAVFVDGFRRPEEALEGLKAAAAMKGGNAVINVNTGRTTAGRCSASGDAVVVRRIRSDE